MKFAFQFHEPIRKPRAVPPPPGGFTATTREKLLDTLRRFHLQLHYKSLANLGNIFVRKFANPLQAGRENSDPLVLGQLPQVYEDLEGPEPHTRREDVVFVPLASPITDDPRSAPDPSQDEFLMTTGNLLATVELMAEVAVKLALEDDEELLLASTAPIRRAFVYFDISDYSKHASAQQLVMLDSLNRSVAALLVNIAKRTNAEWNALLRSYDTRMCIGDGYIFVWRDPVHAATFAALLAAQIQTISASNAVFVPCHFRIGVHVGDVHGFWDPAPETGPAAAVVGQTRTITGRWNYAGKGINDGARILASVGRELDDVVFVSDAVYRAAIAERGTNRFADQIVKNCTARGRKKDKHDLMHRVFEMATLIDGVLKNIPGLEMVEYPPW